jgi:hypothetical protein
MVVPKQRSPTRSRTSIANAIDPMLLQKIKVNGLNARL